MQTDHHHSGRASQAFRLPPLCVTLGALLLLSTSRLPAREQTFLEARSVFDMSIEELVSLQISAGTLGGSDLRHVPAAITTITSEDIQDSGARNLNELLEIYVPNLLYLRHNWEASHIGFRGVVGDIDNKYLILVNGKVMNNMSHAGAISERDLAMLGDIQEIRVVRGPGSAVYGAGALSGVIDIRTFNGTTFTGTEITGRGGIVENFWSAEAKHGRKLGDSAHWFIYAGISDLLGADSSAAPYIMSLSGLTFDGTPIVAGRPYPVRLREDRQSFRGRPQLKFHSELTVGDFSIWGRYTRGGERQDLEQRWLIQWPIGFAYDEPSAFLPHEIGYQQISFGADYRKQLSEHWELSLRAGYSIDDFVRQEFDVLIDGNREDLYSLRALATWTPHDRHTLVFGAEYLHAEFGMPSLGFPPGPPISSAWESGNPPRWNTDTWSLLAEDRWDFARNWILFLGLRMDKNDYTDFMFSPRAAVVFTPTSKDTLKLILSQSVKANVAEELRWQHENSSRKGDTETLRAAEFAYTRLLTEQLSVGANLFYNNIDIIGWDERTHSVGEVDIAGIEIEARYHSRHFRLGLSHSYSQLIDIRNPSSGQYITAKPYGYGRDLNHWSSHITKLQLTYQPVERLRFTSSLRVFWGWPGWEDFSDYETDLQVDEIGDPLTFTRDPSYNPYNKIQARLNVGATYDITKNVTVGLHGYNLLGLFDGHLNDRFIMFSSSARRDAAAAALTLTCRF